MNYGSVADNNVEKDERLPLTTHHGAHEADSSDTDDDDDDHGEGGFFSSVANYSTRLMSERFNDGFLPLVRTVSEGVQTLSHPSFILSEKALDPQEDRHKHFRSAGTSTIPSEVANLSKNTIGGGVMSLSGGIALYANAPQAVVSAILWLLGLGWLFGYFCWLTGRSCDLSLSATYRECWERNVGSRGGILVAIATTLDPLMGLFANSAILSQSLQFVLESVGIFWSIPQCLLIIALAALLPLCLMKNLNALAPFSAFGMAAVFTALGCMTIRYLDGSYLPGGAFHDEILEEYRPSFGQESSAFSFKVMPFVCMAFTSFDMHYNSPRCKWSESCIARWLVLPLENTHTHTQLCHLCVVSLLVFLPLKHSSLHGTQGCYGTPFCPSMQLFVWHCLLSLSFHCRRWIPDLWRQFQFVYSQQLFTQ